ncbi:MAG: GTP-binding protein EngB [Chlamydiia bacterium]|nr:GTP-binding protein EngB [Chlamydiia bacterium]
MKIKFKKAKFLTSCFSTKFPEFFRGEGHFPEVAICGRSNVGKSSMINHLTGSSGLAKVSSVPGKTRLLNFFQIDNDLILVDLPGYGYAKVPLEMVKKWTQIINTYLCTRDPLKLLVILIDSRHPIAQSDKNILDWSTNFSKNVLLVLTKADKLPKSKAKHLLEKRAQEVFSYLGKKLPVVKYSVKDPKARMGLMEHINQLVADSSDEIVQPIAELAHRD